MQNSVDVLQGLCKIRLIDFKGNERVDLRVHSAIAALVVTESRFLLFIFLFIVDF